MFEPKECVCVCFHANACWPVVRGRRGERVEKDHSRRMGKRNTVHSKAPRSSQRPACLDHEGAKREAACSYRDELGIEPESNGKALQVFTWVCDMAICAFLRYFA